MKGIYNTDNGNVIIENEVIAKYAGSAAVECFGVVGMASYNVKDGLVKLLKKDNIAHGVNVVFEEDKLTIQYLKTRTKFNNKKEDYKAAFGN